MRYCSGILALSSLLPILVATASPAHQVEFLASCEGPEPVRIAPLERTEDCELAPAGDADRFQFEAEAGELFRIGLFGTGPGLDPRVELIGPAGGLLAQAACVAEQAVPGPVCVVVLEAWADEAGTHQLRVSDLDGDEAGAYALQLERIPPPPPISTFVLDLSEDPDFVDADSIGLGPLSPETAIDPDWIYVAASPGDRSSHAGEPDISISQRQVSPNAFAATTSADAPRIDARSRVVGDMGSPVQVRQPSAGARRSGLC